MQKYIRQEGININTYNLLVKDGKILSELDYGTPENLFIIKTIENYTKKIDKDIDFKQFSYDDLNDVHTFSIGDDYNIQFQLISENIKSISKTLKNQLESSDRNGKCHTMSILIALLFDKAKILTGTIKYGEKSILHSVVEIDSTKIMDYTRNLIIEKEKYMELFGFHVLNEVDSKYLLEDFEVLKNCGLFSLSSKIYLVFRDEIINDLKKQSFETGKGKRKI